MPKFFTRRGLNRFSIRRRLYILVSLLAALVLIELVALYYSLELISAVRASIQREGVGSKSQKDGVLDLQNLIITENDLWLQKYESNLDVREGIRATFAELRKENPEKKVILEGLKKARVHPDDVHSIAFLFMNFSFLPQVAECTEIFWRADVLVQKLEAFKTEVATRVGTGQLSEQERTDFLIRLNILNEKFTQLETEFSESLGSASRWLDGKVILGLFSLVFLVVIIGASLGLSVSKGIADGITEIVRAAKKVASGDLKAKAKILSEDEIGHLAKSFNEMIWEVEKMNEELGQFVFVASHDLQEPLRTITNFQGLLNDPNKNWSDEEKRRFNRYIEDATQRMHELIRDLMQFTRIGRNMKREKVDVQFIVDQVLSGLDAEIVSSNAQVIIGNMPHVLGSKDDLKVLFYHLLNNALKFAKPDVTPVIHLNYKLVGNEHAFYFKDNGIGISENHVGRIFEVFKRLHPVQSYSGTGIGLAACRKIVNVHKGRIEVESTLGEGSVFTVFFPKDSLVSSNGNMKDLTLNISRN